MGVGHDRGRHHQRHGWRRPWLWARRLSRRAWAGSPAPADTVTVTPATLASIALSPTNPSVSKGLNEQFTATGTYTDGTTANLTTQVTWASATPSVATISNTAGTQGLASTLAVGTTAITASRAG